MTLAETLTKINQQLSRKIDAALTKEVFEVIRDEEAATIYAEVYKVYTPRIYRRRGEYGGLADPYNIELKGGAAKGGRMAVVNVTDPNPGGTLDDSRVTTGKNLPALVECGDGYKFYTYDFPRRGAAYMKPRPFIAKTIENLKKNHAHVAALRAGLKRQGVKTK